MKHTISDRVRFKNSGTGKLPDNSWYQPKPEWGAYRVTISKNGEFVRHIEYSEMSGSAMSDVAFALKRQYPKEQGYKVEW